MSIVDRKRIQEDCIASKYHVDHPPFVNTPQLPTNCLYVDLLELTQMLQFLYLEVKCPTCKSLVHLQSLADLVTHHNHNPRTGEALHTTSENSSPNPKFVDIPFPHDTIMMIHEVPSLENEYPRLTEMFSKMHPPRTQ